MDPDQLIKSISSATVQSILSYSIVVMKDGAILRRILEKILYELYDDLETKNYLTEALTGALIEFLDANVSNFRIDFHANLQAIQSQTRLDFPRYGC